MEIVPAKKPTAFRLNSELLSRLKVLAKRENRSLNNYVETLLFDAVYREPNEETMAAMSEAESGATLDQLDLDDLDRYVASL